jgi:hypothetical protein
MPCYTFHVGDAATLIEMTGVDLEDNDTAREYAITFVAELFRSRHQDFPDWESCNIQVLARTSRMCLRPASQLRR